MTDADSGGAGAGANNGGGAAAQAQQQANTMMSHLKPPRPLTFNLHKVGMAEQWTAWKDEFLLYISLAMGNQTEKQKIDLLKYLIGKEGRKIFDTFKLNEADAAVYKLTNVLKHFDDDFVAKRNINVERYRLFSRRQGPDETMDQFLTELKVLASTCELGNLEDSLLQTVIMMGITNSALRERLLNKDQTLAQCMQMCRSSEIIKANKAELEGKEQEAKEVNKINKKQAAKQSTQRGRKKKILNVDNRAPAGGDQPSQRKQYGGSGDDQRKKYKNYDSSRQAQREVECFYCGRKHVRNKFDCPAFGKKCTKCGYRNHFEVVCQRDSKRVDQVEHEQVESEEEYEDVRKVVKVDRVGQSIIAKMLLGGSRERQQEVPFEVDCGASCDILPQHYLTSIQHKIETTKTVLKMYDGNLVTPIGKTTLKVTNPRTNSKYLVGFEIVSDGKYVPILGRKSSEKMGLIEVKYDNMHVSSIKQDTTAATAKPAEIKPQTAKPAEIKPQTAKPAEIKPKTAKPAEIKPKTAKPAEIKPKTAKPAEIKPAAAKSSRVQPLTRNELLQEFPDNFEGTGKLPGIYHIEIDETVKPAIHAARRVPVALQQELKNKLDELVEQGIIVPETEPTDWVSSLTVVKKPSGKLRLCLDPKELNSAIKRSHYHMTTIEDILPDLTDAKVFSVLDAKNGFWHVELDEYSSKLTCFNTPHGRFRWLRMPFGLKSATEEYARRQAQALEGLEGVKIIADDLLIFGVGATQEEAIIDHNNRLRQLMQRCQQVGLKLNKDKAQLGLTQIPFLGHVISDSGLLPDPRKIQAVIEMPQPTDVKGVQRLIGFVNYLQKFLPNLSDLCEPLRQLTVKGTVFDWTASHTAAFDKIKAAVTAYPVLRYFSNDKEVTLQVDSSETGLGAALLQEGQPVAYASRALTDPETRYAQIEKELLAAAYGLEKFHVYTYGRKVKIQSDHKPLEVIQKKPLHRTPKRLQRILLQMAAYDYDIYYVPGVKMYLADTLSRAYLPYERLSTSTAHEIETINMIEDVDLPADSIASIRQQTQADEHMQQLKQIILQGWPEDKAEVPPQLMNYFHLRDELTVQDDLIYRGERVVIPSAARRNMLTEIHAAHMGIEATLRRSRESIYWPGMTTQIADYISRCEICQQLNSKQQKETLKQHETPDRPWAKIGTDIFTLHGRDYLITVDYFSGFWEIDCLLAYGDFKVGRL